MAMPFVMAFVVLPTASRSVRTCAPAAFDVAGHLGDALGVVGDRSEGVHGDDDADRGEQTGAGQCHREEGQHDRRAAEQEGPVDAEADEQRRVDGGLQAHGDPGEDDGGGSGQGGLADVADGTAVGLGEVAGQLLDQGREDDADGDGDDGQDPRVTGVVRDRGVLDADELLVGARQVRVDRDGDEHQGDHGGDEESAVDGGHPAAVAAARGDREDADHGRDHADGGHDQREGEAEVAEGGLAEDECGHQGDGVGLEEVGCHSRAVADVVAHVVGDGRGIARVVLRNALLDLADQVGADVGGLGEDAASDTHEHRDQRGPEAEALQDLGGVGGVDQHDAGGAEEAEADGEHADDATRAEGDLHRLVGDVGQVLGGLPLGGGGLARGGGDADVGADREAHADVAGCRREEGAHEEEGGPSRPLRPVVGGEQEEQEEDHDGEDREGAQL